MVDDSRLALERLELDVNGRPRRGVVRTRGWTIPRNLRIEEDRPAGEKLLRWARPITDWRKFGRMERVEPPASLAVQRALLQRFWSLGYDALRARRGEFEETVLDMSRQWGPLYLCQHRQPARYCSELECQSRIQSRFPAFEMGEEPIEGWVAWASEAALVVGLAEAVQFDKKMVKADEPKTESAFDSLKEFVREKRPGSVLFEVLRLEVSDPSPQWAVQSLLNEWLVAGDVSLALSGDSEPRLMVVTDGLFGMLGLQLAAVVAGSQSIWPCDYCEMPHFRRRAPQSGHKACCGRPECVTDANTANDRKRRENKVKEEMEAGNVEAH